MNDELYKYINISEQCKLDKTVFKKLFYENAIMNASYKEIFKNHIDKITFKYSLKEELLNVPAFNNDELNYDEIEILEVNLLDDSKYSKICEIIQKTIPYPMIIVLTFKDKILINTAYKRVNKNDSEKNTVENYINSNWIDLSNMTYNEEQFMKSIDIRNLSFINMYKLYDSFVEKINILNTSQIAGDFDNLESKDIEQVNKLSEEIKCIDDEINKLRTSIKKESQFNRKMDMNIKIKKLESKRKDLIEELKS